VDFSFNPAPTPRRQSRRIQEKNTPRKAEIDPFESHSIEAEELPPVSRRVSKTKTPRKPRSTRRVSPVFEEMLPAHEEMVEAEDFVPGVSAEQQMVHEDPVEPRLVTGLMSVVVLCSLT
jgi:hypothetical protein